MTPETKAVLRHWKNNWLLAVKNCLFGHDIDSDACPYCHKYTKEPGYFACERCPIYKKTKLQFCEDTPHSYVEDYVVNEMHEELKEAVWAELQFLLQIAWEEEE